MNRAEFKWPSPSLTHHGQQPLILNIFDSLQAMCGVPQTLAGLVPYQLRLPLRLIRHDHRWLHGAHIILLPQLRHVYRLDHVGTDVARTHHLPP